MGFQGHQAESPPEPLPQRHIATSPPVLILQIADIIYGLAICARFPCDLCGFLSDFVLFFFCFWFILAAFFTPPKTRSRPGPQRGGVASDHWLDAGIAAEASCNEYINIHNYPWLWFRRGKGGNKEKKSGKGGVSEWVFVVRIIRLRS